MGTNHFFVLGASDPEMHEIERVLQQTRTPYAYALTRRQKRVGASGAYKASHVSAPVPPGCLVVMVECHVPGLRCDHVIDHHSPGDPGFSMPPDQYLAGSSLGQTLELLGLEPTQEQRVICAADHCLTAAYKGLCPGVSSAEVSAYRLQSRAKNRNVELGRLLAEIDQARTVLECAPKVDIAGVPVAWVDSADDIPELSEASARFGVPMMYRRQESRQSSRMKVGIRGAPANVIAEWMQACGLTDVYGVPERGFAGGYF